MVRRVRQMQRGTLDIDFSMLDIVPEETTPQASGSRILTPQLQMEISAHLPTWCRYREWQLAYSPDVHGTSMQTFYRSQADGNANVIVVCDSDGCVFGGFSSESWRISVQGYHGTGDCFVFTTLKVQGGELPTGGPERSLVHFFHATGKADVLLWGDDHMLSLGNAFFVQDNFRSGTTIPC